MTTTDALAIARAALQRLRTGPESAGPACEVSEESEESPAIVPKTNGAVDPFVRWRLQNAERLTVSDLAHGRDAGGYCAEHRRCLSWPEQKRGACSWCVPVDPEREPEYWASHWRRFTERP
jgi:hypothetical protein